MNIKIESNCKIPFAIIRFAYELSDEIEDITIVKDSEEDHVYTINGTKYFIISNSCERIDIDSYNNDLLEDVLFKCPPEYKDFLDTDKWLEENGVVDMEALYSATHYSTYIEWVKDISSYSFYEIIDD